MPSLSRWLPGALVASGVAILTPSRSEALIYTFDNAGFTLNFCTEQRIALLGKKTPTLYNLRGTEQQSCSNGNTDYNIGGQTITGDFDWDGSSSAVTVSQTTDPVTVSAWSGVNASDDGAWSRTDGPDNGVAGTSYADRASNTLSTSMWPRSRAIAAPSSPTTPSGPSRRRAGAWPLPIWRV
jgi:hypothetical protein